MRDYDEQIKLKKQYYGGAKFVEKADETEETSQLEVVQIERKEIESVERSEQLGKIKQVTGQIREISTNLKDSLVSQNQYISFLVTRQDWWEHYRGVWLAWERWQGNFRRWNEIVKEGKQS